MKTVSPDATTLKEQQLFSEIDHLASEIEAMLLRSHQTMEHARRVSQENVLQIQSLERQLQCWND